MGVEVSRTEVRVIKYIFGQLGAGIGDGIFNVHLPLLCEFSASDWAEKFPVQSELRVKVLRHSPGVCGRFVACPSLQESASREGARKPRGTFHCWPPFLTRLH